MASEVYSTEELKLQDGTEVTVRPLAIGRLRRFFKAWQDISKVSEEEDNDGFDVYINCSGVALEENFKGQFDALKATPDEQEQGEHLNPKYKEYLEGVLDLETIFKILEVAGGIQLNDPKLVEAAMEAAREQEKENRSSGKSST